jgi:hypothetical protein
LRRGRVSSELRGCGLRTRSSINPTTPVATSSSSPCCSHGHGPMALSPSPPLSLAPPPLFAAVSPVPNAGPVWLPRALSQLVGDVSICVSATIRAFFFTDGPSLLYPSASHVTRKLNRRQPIRFVRASLNRCCVATDSSRSMQDGRRKRHRSSLKAATPFVVVAVDAAAGGEVPDDDLGDPRWILTTCADQLKRDQSFK